MNYIGRAASLGLLFMLIPLRGINSVLQPYAGIVITSSFVIHMLFICLLPFFVIDIYRNSKTGINILFGISILCAVIGMILVTLYQNLTSQLPIEDSMEINVRMFQLGIVYYAIVHMIVGYIMVTIDILLYRVIIFIGFICFSITCLYFIDYGSFTLDFSQVDEEFSGNYLLVGDTFAVSSFLVISLSINRFAKILLMIFTAIMLYALYSRTSLYGYLFSILFCYIIKSNLSATKLVSIAGLLIFAVSLGSIYFEFLLNNRMFSFIFDAYDNSVAQRNIQFQIGWVRLLDNWFIGDYAGQVITFGKIGAYMHNLLSYWQQYGLVIFIFIIASIFFVLREIVFQLTKINANKYFPYIAVYALVTCIFSRSYVYPLLWLTIGAALSLNIMRAGKEARFNFDVRTIR